MAPKRVVEKVEAKQVLTAVLLADSFTQRFRPITVEKPKVLLPLVNAPLLEYTLEWLALNRVEEIIIFCCAHADQIKAHLADSKWSKQRSPRVVTVTATNCVSLGEALRSLDQKDIIKSHFILVSGDTVSNMDLAPALAAHRERAERDKDTLMTLVMKPTRDAHQRLRLGDSNLLVAVDAVSQRLLKYQELEGPAACQAGAAGAEGEPSSSGHHHGHHHHHHSRRGGRGQCWKLDAAFWSERDCVSVRYDLMDTHISICSPEVLMMFSDNFDYQTLKRDFVVGTLSEEELGKKIYCHVLAGEYAARIHNLRSFDAVSRDILARWVFPFAPDTNVFSKAGTWGPSSYRYARGHKYLEAATTCSRSAQLGPGLAIGSGSSIADGCALTNCVVGRGCSIGRNCRLSGCYLQDGVVLGDGVTASHCLLCEGVVVGAGATVLPGCVLSYGVVVAPRHTVPAHSIITLCKQLQSQVSLSDDETEYASAGRRTSSSGGGPQAAAAAARRRRASATGGSRGRRRAAASDSESSSSSSSDGGDDGGGSSSSASSGGGFEDLAGSSLEKPSNLTLRMAQLLARGSKDAKAAAAADIRAAAFDTALVGEGGAGYAWPLAEGAQLAAYSIAPPAMKLPAFSYDSDAEDSAAGGGGASDEGGGGREGGDAAARDAGSGNGSGAAKGGAAALDPETVFMQEVAETFLRCVKERFAETNVLIELNGLKIAEDRSFADCARYILAAMMQLCLPVPPWVSPEYACLFPAAAPDSSSKDGKLALLARFKRQLGEWSNLLRRFLKSEDDQVELLLTLEEFCSEEGVFEPPPGASSASASGGAAFAPLFANVLQLLYDGDIVEEAAITCWAGEKEHADEGDKVFLHKCSAFLEWLQTADEDSDEEEE